MGEFRPHGRRVRRGKCVRPSYAPLFRTNCEELRTNRPEHHTLFPLRTNFCPMHKMMSDLLTHRRAGAVRRNAAARPFDRAAHFAQFLRYGFFGASGVRKLVSRVRITVFCSWVSSTFVSAPPITTANSPFSLMLMVASAMRWFFGS